MAHPDSRPAPIGLEALQASIGRDTGTSGWFIVDQVTIDHFADLTQDWNFIHVDPVRAQQTPFGGTIAHGFLTLSLLSAMAYQVVPPVEGMVAAVNYGFNKVRFVTPVRAGSRVRGRFMLLAAEVKAQQVEMTHGVAVEIEGMDRPALTAEWVSRALLAPPEASPEAKE